MIAIVAPAGGNNYQKDAVGCQFAPKETLVGCNIKQRRTWLVSHQATILLLVHELLADEASEWILAMSESGT
jgi:hypothetical protein